jgi:hypothetical protein
MIHRSVVGYDKGMESASLFPCKGKDMLRDGSNVTAFSPRLQLSLASSA